MPLSTIDFGESIIPLTGTDAFFLDTNIIIAYLYDKHEKHLPCFSLINYLSKNNVVMCVSEIVVVELINSFARVLYIADQIADHVLANGEPQTSKEMKDLEWRFKSFWSNKVIKTQPEILKQYNSLACSKIETIIPETLLIECNEQIVEDTMSIISSTPLASADSMIISMVINFGCQYLLSIDRDMNIATNVEIISTVHNNDNYDISDMLNKLDIFQYLLSKLGEIEFKRKFPTLTVPVIN